MATNRSHCRGYGTIAQSIKQPADRFAGANTAHYQVEQNEFQESAAAIASGVQRRQLTTPLLLFLAAHRPLTFLGGQLLYLLAPLCELFGWQAIGDWAALLSAPDAGQRLDKLLTMPAQPGESAGRVR
jgi:hypothetical protein